MMRSQAGDLIFCQEIVMPLGDPTPAPPGLDIALDKLAFIVEKAREFDVKEADSDPHSGSNPTDDDDADILEDKGGDPTREELAAAIRGLNQDERAQLVALAWLGRGTYALDEWDEAVATARSEHHRRTAEYLLNLPLLGDYLQDGLAMFGETVIDTTDEREGLNSEDEPLGNMPDKPPRQ
jgi:hypothetical protein